MRSNGYDNEYLICRLKFEVQYRLAIIKISVIKYVLIIIFNYRLVSINRYSLVTLIMDDVGISLSNCSYTWTIYGRCIGLCLLMRSYMYTYRCQVNTVNPVVISTLFNVLT